MDSFEAFVRLAEKRHEAMQNRLDVQAAHDKIFVPKDMESTYRCIYMYVFVPVDIESTCRGI